MTARRPRVLIVDDSAFARRVLREILSAENDFDVVGYARDGVDALEKIAELAPDVITLDLVMPEMDGVRLLEELEVRRSQVRAVVVTTADEQSELGVAALAAGAFDVVHKPTSIATDRLYELRDELVAKVRAAAGAPPGQRRPASVPVAALPRHASPAADLVVIGASTGGPAAIAALLAALPSELPSALALVLHMPIGYTGPFAERLGRECALDVVEARDGLELVPGRAAIGRAGVHFKIERSQGRYRARLDVEPTGLPHRPSVDVLFASAAATGGARVLGVVLTGMGDDGLIGARAIRDHGGRVLVEHESSCVVYGMPRAVWEAGLAERRVPLGGMARAIVAALLGPAEPAQP
jgi:two-component system, chemotaxis family, protein-glutamate methylesterase/glutaminase